MGGHKLLFFNKTFYNISNKIKVSNGEKENYFFRKTVVEDCIVYIVIRERTSSCHVRGSNLISLH